MDYVIFILWALVMMGFGLGLFASREWISKPLRETETKLRKELGEVRTELFEMTGRWGSLATTVRRFRAMPPIEHCDPSDVFFFNNFEDLL